MKFRYSPAFARSLDRADPLKHFRRQFHLPQFKGKDAIYFTGNSLGLQPKSTRQYIEQELRDWAQWGVEGHFRAKRPWVSYHRLAKKSLARMVGARPAEVVAMNQLTVNLHLLMISFYRPTAARYKIIIEQGAFPSDQYAFESQVRFHGLDPRDAIVEIGPRPGEHGLRTDDITEAIQRHGPQTALVLFGAVQYYTGQFFNLPAITEAAHRAGAVAGFDLAHAIGNVPLALHRWGVDFAVWCSYKYLNSGPGGMAGAFVHQKHGANFSLPRLAGWWGHNERLRFKMEKGFDPMPGADGWQLSNVPVLSGAAHLASLELFARAGMGALRKKSVQLTGFLDYLLHEIDAEGNHFTVLTPRHPGERGCQLSLFMHRNGKRIFDFLQSRGVMADWREPDVIRVAPVPFYNTFEEVFRFAELLRQAVRL
jgi:kynureninase